MDQSTDECSVCEDRSTVQLIHFLRHRYFLEWRLSPWVPEKQAVLLSFGPNESISDCYASAPLSG